MKGLEASRFTLLLGPGGAGKTRLARAVATRRADLRPLFCDLSNVASKGDVVGALAAMLGLSLDGADSAAGAEQLSLAFGECAGRLVILDNLETVGEGAQVVLALLDRGPCFLGTSRVTEPFLGATVIELGPLPKNEALALFVDRARIVAPEFEADLATEALLDKLDGSPLAIELAAARAHVLAPEALLARFSRHLDLLRGGAELPARHRSMRAVVEGSWLLSTGSDRRALAAASIFRGGFELAAAEMVIGDDAAERLEALLRSSLVFRGGRPELGPRFFLSESVREYAAERLAEDPAELARVARLYAEHYRAIAERLHERASNADPRALAVLSAETENLVAGFRIDGRSAFAFDIVFQRAMPVDMHVALLTAARTRVAGELAHSAELELAMAHAVRRAGVARNTLAQASLAEELTEQHGNPTLIAGAQLIKAAALYDAGMLTEAARAARRAVESARSCGAHATAARGLALLGFSALETGELVLASRSAEQSIALAQEYGLTLVEFNAENLFGAVQARRGEPAAAQDHLRRGLTIIRGLGLAQQEALALGNLGKVLMMSGESEDARRVLEEALDLGRRAGLRRLELVHLTNLAQLDADLGRFAQARSRAALAAALAKRIDSRVAVQVALLLGSIALCEGRSEEAVSDFDRALELARQFEGGAGRASACAGRAAACASLGRLSDAEAALDDARRAVQGGESIDLSIIAARTAAVCFCEARAARARGDADGASKAHADGLLALQLSERRAPTSVEVRIARRCALSLAEQAGSGAGAARSAEPRFELVSRGGVAPAETLPVDADLGFDALQRRVVVDGRRAIDLRKKPLAARLLEVVMQDPKRSLGKGDLYREVWQTEFRRSSQAAALYKAVDRLAHLLDADPRRFLRWDETGALVLVARRPALLRPLTAGT